MSQEIDKMLGDLQRIVPSPDAINRSGEGKALQSVAQSSAIAVQDAVDNLRNVSTISTTAIGTAMSKYLETQMPTYLEVISEAQDIVAKATAQLEAVGKAAAAVLQEFAVK